MKKLFLTGLFIIGGWHELRADHLFGINASNITRGTLPDQAINYSSITARGGAWDEQVEAATTTIKNRFDTFTSTTQTEIEQFNVALSTIESKLSNGPVAVYDGTVQGNATTFEFGANLSATCSGSTCSVNSTASGGGQVVYSLVVGTNGALNVDLPVTNLTTFNQALTMVGACGLTNSSSATATIFFRDGVYQIIGATIPAGIKIVAGSSVVWQYNGIAGQSMVNIYGKMDGVKFDLGNVAVAARVIVQSSQSVLSNFDIYNANNLQQGPSDGFSYCNLCIVGSNTVTQGSMREFNIQSGAASYGDNAPLKIMNTSFNDVKINMDAGSIGNAGSVGIVVVNSNNVNIHDGVWNNIGGNFLTTHGVANIFIERNKMIVTRTAGDTGLILLSGQVNSAAYASTGTISISDNSFEIRTADGTALIGTAGGGGTARNGIKIKNNVVHTNAPGTIPTYRLVTLASTAIGAYVGGNNVNGISAFTADSGSNNLFAGQGNTLNNTEQ